MAYTGKVTSAESLGRILQQARLLSCLSQRELADRLGSATSGRSKRASPRSLWTRLFAIMRETGMELTASIEPGVTVAELGRLTQTADPVHHHVPMDRAVLSDGRSPLIFYDPVRTGHLPAEYLSVAIEGPAGL